MNRSEKKWDFNRCQTLNINLNAEYRDNVGNRSAMTSSRVVYRQIETAPTAFDGVVDTYANVLLHPVVRSLMLQDEEDYKSHKFSFYNQMRTASKDDYKRIRVTTGDQILLNGVKSRGTIEYANKPSLERAPRRSLNMQRNSQGIETSKNSCGTMIVRNEPEGRSLDHEPRESICEHAVTKYRERLNYYEARRLQRQSDQLGIEYRPLRALNTDNSSLTYRMKNDSDYCGAKKVQNAKSTEEIDELCEKVRDHVSVIRDRIRSSRALLAKQDSDGPVARKAFHGPSSVEQGSAEFDAKFYRETNQEKGYPLLLPREAFEIESDSIAFEPFLPKTKKSISWNDAPSYGSYTSPKSQDMPKPQKLSKSETCKGAGPSISTEATSIDKKLQIDKEITSSTLKPKVINKLTAMKRISRAQKVLLCASSRKNFHEGHSGQWSHGTADSSSCATPSTANCDDSRDKSINSKDSKKERSGKSISSFTQEKGLNDEWLRSSIDRGIVRTESEREMQEWLNAKVLPGWDIARQESARYGPMEMVFMIITHHAT